MSHEERVARLSARIRAIDAAAGAAQIDKGGVPHFVPLPDDTRSEGQQLRIDDLDQILSIDKDRRICVAEPGVTFGRLVRATLPQGLIPAVVPELEGITLGGAVAGCSVEAMSYRVGGFHDTCLEYEVVSGTGDVLSCSRDPERDPLVFEMMHGSYGTLGILTRLTFRLVPARPFVRMTYRKFDAFDAFWAELLGCCDTSNAEHDFVDAVVHGPDELVLCLGDFVDEAPYLSNYRWLNVFYKSTRARSEDYLTTEDYCFRYDTECHWLTRTVPGLETKAMRFVLGKLVLGSTNLITWSKRLERITNRFKRRPDVVCDVFIPSGRFSEFFSWYARDFDFYPLWVIPYRAARVYPWLDPDYAKGFGGDLFIDCAVYGKPNSEPEVDYSELLESKTIELNGIKTLISSNHFTPETFWRVYNRDNFEAMKQRLDPKGLFPEIYSKFHSM